MQRNRINLQYRTYTVSDLRKIRVCRGELPPLPNYSNDVEDFGKVGWNNMPSSAVILDSFKKASKPKEKQKVEKDTLDRQIDANKVKEVKNEK